MHINISNNIVHLDLNKYVLVYEAFLAKDLHFTFCLSNSLQKRFSMIYSDSINLRITPYYFFNR